MPDWLADALAQHRRRRELADIDWDDADRDAHRAGVLACLEAIAAGEVYQACVCTQFTGTVDGAAARLLRRRASHAPRPPGRRIVAGDWGAVASLSPELFLRRRGDVGDVQPDQGHAAAGLPIPRRCGRRSRTSPRTS